jgi:hypothetical protein
MPDRFLGATQERKGAWRVVACRVMERGPPVKWEISPRQKGETVTVNGRKVYGREVYGNGNDGTARVIRVKKNRFGEKFVCFFSVEAEKTFIISKAHFLGRFPEKLSEEGDG